MDNYNNLQSRTQNPQNKVSGNLQLNSPNLQPITNNRTGINPNALPRTDSLKVLTIQPLQVVSVPKTTANPPVPGSGTSLWTFSIAAFILAVLLLTMAKFAKPTPKVTEKKDDILKDKSLVPSTSSKTKNKKSSKKKSSKKKRR